MWEPRDESQILAAIDSGDLRENSHLDVKRELTRGDGARTELARDLASFAIDGGALLIGVAENKDTKTFSLAPLPLAGVAEQIENIASNRIDPPLFIRVRDIPSEADSSTGYLFVEVPPSPAAPHMVDGRYPARGDRTKRSLKDAEVVRLHAARESQDLRVARVLQVWASREVVPSDRRRNGHLYLVAEPLTQPNPRAYEAVARAANNTPVFDLVARVENSLPRDMRNFSPSLRAANHWVRRSDGASFTSLNPGPPILAEDQGENQLMDFEIHDNGGVRILMGRLVDEVRDGSDRRSVLDGAALAYACRLLRIVRHISEDTGYRGAWGFGIRADELRGAVSNAVIAQRTYVFSSDAHPYETDKYEAVTLAHGGEIEDDPAAVVDRLVGRLLQGLGSYELLRSYLDLPGPARSARAATEVSAG